jgi:hypothetical protein
LRVIQLVNTPIQHINLNKKKLNLKKLHEAINSDTSFRISSLKIKISNITGKVLINYVSIFIKFRVSLLNSTFTSKKFLIKKSIFSFLKPNEAKKSILNRRKRITASRFYKKLIKSSLTRGITETSKYKSFFRTKTTFFDINSKNSLSQVLTTSKDSSELFLPRVKFKPGYQRMWRQSRKAIADSIGLRYIYQKQMTKYMLRLSRKVNNYSFSLSENSLDKAILYSRLLPDLKAINEFVSIGLISLNGYKVTSLNSFVLSGDFIQLTISKWLSIYFRWLIVWANSNKNKFKTLVFRKGLASSYKLMKQRKQRSVHVPLWIYNSRFDLSDVKPNYEVDYFTMSSFVLYEPLLIDYYSPDDLPDHRHYIYRLYNWKYIT